MNSPLGLVLAFSSIWAVAWAAPGSTTTVEVKITKAPGDFLRNVGRQCLSTPGSKIALGRGGVRIEDETQCASDLKALASAWEVHADHGVMAAYIPTERKEEVKKTMTRHFNENQSRLISDAPNCPCLVFSGPKSADAARLATAIGSRSLR